MLHSVLSGEPRFAILPSGNVLPKGHDGCRRHLTGQAEIQIDLKFAAVNNLDIGTESPNYTER